MLARTSLPVIAAFIVPGLRAPCATDLAERFYSRETPLTSHHMPSPFRGFNAGQLNPLLPRPGTLTLRPAFELQGQARWIRISWPA